MFSLEFGLLQYQLCWLHYCHRHNLQIENVVIEMAKYQNHHRLSDENSINYKFGETLCFIPVICKHSVNVNIN